jgi:NAD+ synthase (glutamine-hydrolysing)
MSASLRIALAQLNLFVGDVAGNTQRIIASSAEARDRLQADLVLFPELSLSGYPPEDLLFHAGLRQQVKTALDRVRRETSGINVVTGYPEYVDEDIYNAAAVLRDGKTVANYRKQELPNYAVFDEKRYFKSGRDSCIVEIKGIRVGLIICEDVWFPNPARAAKDHGAASRRSGARACARNGLADRVCELARRPG